VSHQPAEPTTADPSRYLEQFNEDLLALLPEGARTFLDVGCAGGRLGAAIKQRRPGARVDGLEYDAAAAELAREHLDVVHQVDLDQGLPALEQVYDCVVCGDVLEHLVDPWVALRRLVGVLRPGGHVVASIPNVRYYKVLRDLVLRGRFTYREVGVLDSTHLRFFTLHEMRRLFAAAGLTVLEARPRLGGGNALLRTLDACLLGGLEELRAVQYTLVGRLAPQPAGDAPAAS